MTTLRDRIAALLDERLSDCRLAEVTVPALTRDILALFRVEAPPSDEGKVYPPVRACELEPHYCKHISAMTSEGLHGKADIAEQLALRDHRAEEAFARGYAKSEAERAELQRRLDEWENAVGAHGDTPDRLRNELIYDRDKRRQLRTRAGSAERERDAAREELREVGESLVSLCRRAVVELGPAWFRLHSGEWSTHKVEEIAHDGTPAGIITALLAARKAGAGK